MVISVFIGGTRASSITASTTLYWALGGGSLGTDVLDVVEASSQVPIGSSGSFNDLWLRIPLNDRGSSSFKVRKNGVDANLNLAIGAASTGEFEDTTNSDSASAGDLYNYQMNTGAGGTISNARCSNLIFTSSAVTSTVTRFINHANSTGGQGAANATFHGSPFGEFNNTTNSTGTAITARTNGTRDHFSSHVLSNARSSNTTAGSRLNGANGNLLVTFGPGVTGVLEDTANSDVIVAGDTFSNFSRNGTGTGSIVLTFYSSQLITANNQQLMGGNQSFGVGFVENTVQYNLIGAMRGNLTESLVQTKALIAGTVSAMAYFLISNGVLSSTSVTFRISAADGNLNLTIGTGATGEFEDLINTDVISATDEICDKAAVGAGGSSIVPARHNYVFQTPAASRPTWRMLTGMGV